MKKDAFKRGILIIPVIINTVIFIVLSILHFYWAVGGKRWYEEVLPTSSSGLKRLNPGAVSGLMVALGLMLFAFITAGNQGLFDRYIKRTYFRIGTLVIVIIFFLRAIGDFKFIGFFKTVKSTRFAINDTQIFSPLCLFIALLSVLVFIFNRKRA
ncbi:MAG TPA: DUF3995 domain-containing protein [Ferruginibacter sp.]|nr:DUF3995 domain-containing protein [Ferruginibacter sp.]